MKVTTASVKERKEIFEELRQCIKGRGEIFISVSFLQISVSCIHCDQLDLTFLKYAHQSCQSQLSEVYASSSASLHTDTGG